MHIVRYLLLTAMVVFGASCDSGSIATQAQEPSAGPISLTGQVTSSKEGTMEGVLVSARRAGGTKTVTVVTSGDGRYSFPPGRLEAGDYTLTIRAAGYALDSGGHLQLAAGSTSKDLTLRPIEALELGRQLSNAEWLMSMPGTDEQKMGLVGCVHCHSLEPAMLSAYGPHEWEPIVRRMSNYFVASSVLRPQLRSGGGAGASEEAVFDRVQAQAPSARATHLASVNLSSAPHWTFPLRTLPRPSGRATRVVITEWDLPRQDAMPHDVVVAPDGTAWFADFGNQMVGKLDPQTGRVTEFPVPVLRPNMPLGMLDVQLDKDGNVWFGMMAQGGIAKVDAKTGTVQTWNTLPENPPPAARVAMVAPWQHDVDGKVWASDVQANIYRIDVRTGAVEEVNIYGTSRRGSIYGIGADSNNNLYFNNFSGQEVGRVDAKTLEVTFFRVPTADSRPRRGYMDAANRWWFGEYRAYKVGMFDTKTKNFREWDVRTKWSDAYDARPDRTGNVWYGGQLSDLIGRIDTTTGEVTEYLLPGKSTNIRRLFVDDSTTPPSMWIGDNLGASILRVEPLD